MNKDDIDAGSDFDMNMKKNKGKTMMEMDVDMNTNTKNDMKNNDMMTDEGSYDDNVKSKEKMMDRRMKGWVNQEGVMEKFGSRIRTVKETIKVETRRNGQIKGL